MIAKEIAFYGRGARLYHSFFFCVEAGKKEIKALFAARFTRCK